MHFYLVLTLLSLAAVQGVSSESVRWIGMFDWAAVTYLESEVTFNCTLHNSDGTIVAPENMTVKAGSERWQLPGSSKLYNPGEVTENMIIQGATLEIHNVTLANKGIYLCHAELECLSMACNATDRWFKHGLNLNGPLYANLMERYKSHFIIGSIAAGTALVIMVLSCAVYKFRYKDDSLPRSDSTDGIQQVQRIGEANGVTNVTYNGADADDTKM